MEKWGSKQRFSQLYSQRGQVGREDPHSLSGHEPPAEQKKWRLQKTNTSVGEAHILPHTGLPVFKQAQREMKNLLVPKVEAERTLEQQLFTKNAAAIRYLTKETCESHHFRNRKLKEKLLLPTTKCGLHNN